MPDQNAPLPASVLHVLCPSLPCDSRIVVGRGLLAQAKTLISREQYGRVVIVADSGATHSALSGLSTALEVPEADVLLLDGGESLKEFSTLSRIWSFFQSRAVDRSSLVVQIGGGALTDVAGFASATYMRGIPCVNVPTTLLAQVDASVGGKTGINFQGVKNLVGTTQQPRVVVVDIDTLHTLPVRELTSGFAEIVKHGLIADDNYFERVTSKPCNQYSLDELVPIIHRSCEIKRDVVESDEREVGPRKLLNFGHTVGHAVEAYYLESDHPLTHGEAIGIGMYSEALISAKVGLLTQEDVARVHTAITRVGLPTMLPTPAIASKLNSLIKADKKSVGGSIKWTLLSKIGVGVFDVQVSHELVRASLEAIGSADG